MAANYLKFSLFGFMAGLGLNLCAQTPQIQKVEVLSTYPENRILISGSGFTVGQMQVSFDQINGNITSASPYALEITVPAQARLQNVEVINLSSRLSAKSPLKFMPSFSGEPFSAAKFTAPLSFPSGTELWDLCACDFDGNNKPDIAATKFFSPSTDLMILQNTSTAGNITFAPPASVTMSFPADNAVCGDLNGDGKPELVVSRAGSPRNSIHVLRNTSGALISFAASLNLFLEVGHFATRMAIRDMNADGKADIVVTNSFNNVLYVFQNTSSAGTLSFNTTPVRITVGNTTTTYGVDVQDFDGDRLPDVALTPFQSNDILLLRNQSSGTITFGTAQKITLTGTLNSINSADFNNDSKLDLVVTSTLNNEVHVLLNQSTPGTFSFASPITLAATNGPWGVDISDIDGDSDPDLIVTNRNQALLNVFLHSGNFGSPGFTKADITTSKASRNVKAGDLDGDGKPDLAITTFNSATFTYSLDILRNTNCHKPVILNEQPLTICAGQTIRLNAIPAKNVTFTWEKGGTPIKTSTDAFVDITAADTYSVTATGEGGACSITSASIVVASDPGAPPADPVINSNAPLCAGANLNLTTAAVGGGTYDWTGPNNFASTQQNPTVNSVGFDHAGIYSLQVAIGPCKSNVVTHRVDVVDLAALTISSSVPSNTICQGNTLVLSVTNDPTFDYQWKKDGSDMVGQTNNTLTVSQAGSYSVTVTNTSVSCVKTTNPVSVKVVVPPVAAFQVDATACKNEQLTFTNQSTTDPLATPVYSWNFGDATTSAEASPTHAYVNAQTFTASLLVSYSGISGCTNSIPKNIIVTNSVAPTITATSQEICPGEITTLSIPNTYTSINWSVGGNGTSVVVSQPATVSVTAVDPGGCPVTSEIVIASNPVPTVEVTATKSVIAPGESVQLQAIGADTYSWTPAESLSNATIANPVATPTATTEYTVIGSETGGCSVELTITITVDGSTIAIKPMPLFSPNGDGANELWAIEGAEVYPDCVLAVFDGRGRRVFEKKGYNSDWDGTYQGKPVPQGTYFFVFGCPDKKPVTGSVLIFR
ncbi:MAG: FG-GAP-like repeat-containing protein [Bacteroidota bacterium]